MTPAAKKALAETWKERRRGHIPTQHVLLTVLELEPPDPATESLRQEHESPHAARAVGVLSGLASGWSGSCLTWRLRSLPAMDCRRKGAVWGRYVCDEVELRALRVAAIPDARGLGESRCS